MMRSVVRCVGVCVGVVNVESCVCDYGVCCVCLQVVASMGSVDVHVPSADDLEFTTLDSVNDMGVRVTALEAALRERMSSRGVDVDGGVGVCLGELVGEYRRYSHSLLEYLKAVKRHNDDMKVCVWWGWGCGCLVCLL